MGQAVMSAHVIERGGDTDCSRELECVYIAKQASGSTTSDPTPPSYSPPASAAVERRLLAPAPAPPTKARLPPLPAAAPARRFAGSLGQRGPAFAAGVLYRLHACASRMGSPCGSSTSASPSTLLPMNEFCEDRIGALPDVLLHHVLSLLPAEEAVRTSVLARRWRYLWKFAPGVRLGCLDMGKPVSMNALRKFVDPLLRLRGDLPLHTFELRFDEYADEDDEPRANLWFRHAVACKVQVLKLLIDENNYADYVDPWLSLEDVPLVSRHLTMLQLRGVRCFTGFLDFSSCPALDYLEFEFSDLSLATKIMSQSLKSLTITNSVFSTKSSKFRMQICAPNLIALCLDDLWFNTPVLDSMPSLVDAFVRITEASSDICGKLRNAHQTCDCQYCDSSNNIAYGGSVLLKGLSEARNLALIGIHHTFIFKWDLRWCPTFSKLKTLVLNENWCVPDDLCALACILEHAPNLEKLSLQLFSEGPRHKVEIIGSFSLMDRSTAISEQLKIVEIKCEVVDDRVLKVLHFLCTFGISFRF